MKFAISLALYAVTSAAALTLLSSALHGRQLGSVREAVGALGDVKLLLGAALYVVSFLCWLFVLSLRAVSIAYPLALGASYTAVLLASVVFLDDRMSGVKLAGIVLIAVGALCITTSVSG
jgi:multidrug transporter EmrE-like cation transporter